MITPERFDAWVSGELEDDELTVAEICDLEKRVQNAVVNKILERTGSHTFPQHGTIQ